MGCSFRVLLFFLVPAFVRLQNTLYMLVSLAIIQNSVAQVLVPTLDLYEKLLNFTSFVCVCIF